MNATNSEFASAFTGLMTQARLRGLDVTDQDFRAFLVNTAEVMAQQAAQARLAMSIVNRGTVK